MPIESHIQVPKSILKRFRDSRSNTIHYLDLNTGYIRAVGSSKLGTHPDYYSSEFEQYLSQEVESPFARLVENVLKSDNITIVCELLKNQDNKALVKKYALNLAFRSNCSMGTFIANSQTAFLFPEQDNHDIFVGMCIEKSKKCLYPFENYQLLCVYNRSENVQFVLPRNGFYEIKHNNMENQ